MGHAPAMQRLAHLPLPDDTAARRWKLAGQWALG